MFLHVSVILLMGGLPQCMLGYTPPWTESPLGRHPLDRHPPLGRHPPPGQTLTPFLADPSSRQPLQWTVHILTGMHSCQSLICSNRGFHKHTSLAIMSMLSSALILLLMLLVFENPDCCKSNFEVIK